MHFFLIPFFCVTNIDHQTSAGVFILGAGSKSLMLDNWYWKINELTSFASTTPGDCVPVGESLYGQIGAGTYIYIYDICQLQMRLVKSF